MQGGMGGPLKDVFDYCAHMFSFETKRNYLHLVSMIPVDINRSLHYSRELFKKLGVND